MTPIESVLSGGNSNAAVVRVGDTVRRQISDVSPTIHYFLEFLQQQQFTNAPRFLGIDNKGREILTFIDGQCSVSQSYWQDESYLVSAARLLRTLHDATCHYTSRGNEQWGYIYPDPSKHEVICHNDFGVYNLIAANGEFVAVIDFDLAGPGPRLRDVAYAAYWLVPLSQRAWDMKAAAGFDVNQGSVKLKKFCNIYGVVADSTLLDMVSEVLHYMADKTVLVDSIGQVAADKLQADGHLTHWLGEACAFDEYRCTIEQNLAG